MSRQDAPLRRRRTVASRVLLSYVVVTVAFALVSGWGVYALRTSAAEADLMRSGYLPLSLALRDLVAAQDTWNTQLNHVTSAKNPESIRRYFDAARAGRPRMFGEVRAALDRALMTSGDATVRRVGLELMRETSSIEQYVAGEKEQLTKLFEALGRGDSNQAESLRDQLVTRGVEGKRRLSRLEQRVQTNVEALLDVARARERLAFRLLLVLSAFTLMVGIGMAFYTRRVLRPLAFVTDRAKAVAEGDLTPRPVVASPDEIGELAATFESMVSAIQRANEQLLAAERLATIGKMAAHVTHEVRNPLSSIALNVELLEDEIASQDDEAQALLRAIKGEVERLTALSEQYLSVARQKPAQLESEDLRELVQEACDFMRRDLERHGVTARLHLDGEVPLVLADEGQIKQALFNLIRNAREAMPEGGRIDIGVRGAEGDGVEVTIDDEGTGIDAETREHLFEPFFTTKGRGTGLGLAITRQIVEAHGGTIACESRARGGTRFWIHLPSAARAPA